MRGHTWHLLTLPTVPHPRGKRSGTEARKHTEMMARNLKMGMIGNEPPPPHGTWARSPPSPHFPVCPTLAAAVASSPSCNSPDTTSGICDGGFLRLEGSPSDSHKASFSPPSSAYSNVAFSGGAFPGHPLKPHPVYHPFLAPCPFL